MHQFTKEPSPDEPFPANTRNFPQNISASFINQPGSYYFSTIAPYSNYGKPGGEWINFDINDIYRDIFKDSTTVDQLAAKLICHLSKLYIRIGSDGPTPRYPLISLDKVRPTIQKYDGFVHNGFLENFTTSNRFLDIIHSKFGGEPYSSNGGNTITHVARYLLIVDENVLENPQLTCNIRYTYYNFNRDDITNTNIYDNPAIDGGASQYSFVMPVQGTTSFTA
ncbi:hypothetical protein [Shuangao alphatetra-like virus 1]|uniref:hypothetical protein n=1 Tax=Shuangao alphatetra-like virus 1 TaxID=1923464 RepID=UPI00090B5F61|nr:hypothetical protein [Shuangao alphatetra-like virus 1]APG77640.1 hypothetical protein [Shuangao alphatetra-like virus 1]